MNKKIIWSLTIILCFALYAGAYPADNNTISVLGGIGVFSEKILAGKGQTMTRTDDMLIIDASNRQQTIANLLACARGLKTKIITFLENMETVIMAGEKDIKKFPPLKTVVIYPNGTVGVDKTKEGEPLNTVGELTDFFNAFGEYETIGDIIEKLDNSIILQDPVSFLSKNKVTEDLEKFFNMLMEEKLQGDDGKKSDVKPNTKPGTKTK